MRLKSALAFLLLSCTQYALNAGMGEMPLKEAESKGYRAYTQEEFQALLDAEKLRNEKEEKKRQEALIKAIPKEEPYTTAIKSEEMAPVVSVQSDKTKPAIETTEEQKVVSIVEEPKPQPKVIRQLSVIINDALNNYSTLTSAELNSVRTEILESAENAKNKSLDIKTIRTMPMSKANLQELLFMANSLKL